MDDSTKSRDELLAELENLRGMNAILEARASEAFSSVILNLLDALVVVLNPVGEILLLNHTAETTLGHKTQSVIGRRFVDLVLDPSEHQDPVYAIFHNQRWAVFPRGYESVWITNEGQHRVISWTNDVIYHPPEVVKYVVFTGIDVTHLRRVERELREKADALIRSNSDLERFASAASHDLQEPLRMVISYLGLIERRYKTQLDSDAQEFITYAVDGATRMQQMIEALLEYARLNNNTKPFSPISCADVVRDVLQNLTVAITENQATVEAHDLPNVIGNRPQLTLLFQNLIGNALKFHADNVTPHVKISAYREGKMWVFGVADNGIGIKPRYQEKIFMLFQRLHTREEYPGTGMGLALCQRIVERHGGRIWVESEIGQGATFYFTLPAP